MAQTHRHRGHRIERVADPDRQMDLWSAFVDCYSSTATRTEVNKFLLGLFGVRVEADRGPSS